MINEVEKRILNALNKDVRRSLRQIAKEVGLSPTAIYYKVKKLEELGVIKGYIPLIDKEYIGHSLTAIIGLRANQGKDQEVQEEISKFPQVRAVYEITGEWDLILVCYFKGRKDLTDFVKKKLPSPHIERVITHLVLNTVKDDKRTPIF